jgi:hypothetical protein
VGVEGDGGRFRAEPHTRVECVDGGEFFGGEFEVEDVEVLGDAFGPDRLGDGGSALLDVPASITWAADFPCPSAMARIVGSVKVVFGASERYELMPPMGDQACVRIRCLASTPWFR